MSYGTLRNADTDERIRPATFAELFLTLALVAASNGSGDGIFTTSEHPMGVYVDGEDGVEAERARREWERIANVR